MVLNYRKGQRIVAALLVAAACLGCVHQTVGEQVRKGMLVREEAAGPLDEEKRVNGIELLSPLSVHVFEEIRFREPTRKYYEKLKVTRTARPKEYPYFDAWIKVVLATAIVPLVFPDYWVEGSFVGTDCRKEQNKCVVEDRASVLPGEFFVEDGSRPAVERREVGAGGTVSLFLNGYHKDELTLSSKGTATADLRKYPEIADWRRSVKLTFKFRDAYAYTTLQQDELQRLFSLPATTEGK
jgi:hypothetical protein